LRSLQSTHAIVIFGRTSALLLAMVTPYLFAFEQGRENT
jgi:hypothetical protein